MGSIRVVVGQSDLPNLGPPHDQRSEVKSRCFEAVKRNDKTDFDNRMILSAAGDGWNVPRGIWIEGRIGAGGGGNCGSGNGRCAISPVGLNTAAIQGAFSQFGS